MSTEIAAPPAEGNEETPAPPSRAETNPLRLRILQGRYTGPVDIDGQLRLAAALAKGRRAVPWQYRDNLGDVLAVIQQALALDIQVATALDNLVFSEQGVGGMRAKLMHALLIRAGHEVVVTHHDDRMCRMVLRRGDGLRGGSAQWTLAEARKAGLLEKKGSPWHAYGEDMLWARCLSRLARRFAPDAIAGFYVAEELDGMVPDDELDSADTRTAVDSEGQPVVAPDVEELLKDTDGSSLDELRDVWRQAQQEGMLGAYAGTVDSVDLTVRDYLFARMADEEHKLRARQDPAHVEPVDLAQIIPAADAAPATSEPPTGDDAPAGTGKMSCGCSSAAVLAADGKHEDGCTRPARHRRGGGNG